MKDEIEHKRKELLNKGIGTFLLTNRQILDSFKAEPITGKYGIKRNDPCHCGSGIKYKKYCMDATYKPIACVKSI